MSKHDKTLSRMCKKPVPSDIKWKELEAALVHLGHQVINGNGSRRKFYHPGKDRMISCHQPHPDPHVDKGCISNIVEYLRVNGFLEAEEI